jgi:uncharacterized membrane protein HdeD (DUF308 family)
MSNSAGTIGQGLLGGIKSHARTAIRTGVVLVLAGVASIASPLMAGASLMMVIGAVLVVGGISLMMLAFRLGAVGLRLPLRLFSVLMCLVGGYLFGRPLEALGATTLILATYLVVSGIVELAAAFRARPEPGWGWLALSAVIGIVLGVMLWQQFPLSGIWAVGTLFGIRLLTSGFAMIAMGSAVKQSAADVEAALKR